MSLKLITSFCFFLSISGNIIAQTDTVVYKLYKDRNQLEYRLNKKLINDKLSLELSEKTEEDWDAAFFALQYLNRKDKWVKSRISYAVNEMSKRSNSFNRALLELLYAHYPEIYNIEIEKLLLEVKDGKVWAMCAEYLLLTANKQVRNKIEKIAKARLVNQPENVFYQRVLFSLNPSYTRPEQLTHLFQHDYLPGQVLMISFQRINRNYPGLVIIRDSTGNFLKQPSGEYFSVPQLARSLNGLPGYLTNGNTPRGILRMDGFDVSKAGAIGPTRNVQLSLPFELNTGHFMRDSLLDSATMEKKYYAQLLPEGVRETEPFYQAFYAGKAGRYDIIAHGTTVRSEYYRGTTYYPFTPTMGCLCTYESWDDSTMLRKESDQQKLIEAIERAGGPFGYALIIDLDNKRAPVTLNEILPLLNAAKNE